jgi:general secretion pathway protein H
MMDRRRHSRGFSLLEMLLVLFVIVVLTSLVTLNVNSGAKTRVAQDALQSLRRTAAYALDEAQFGGRDFGLLLVRAEAVGAELRFVWRERLPQGWRSPEQSRDIFTDIDLPDTVTLILDDTVVVPLEPSAAVETLGAAPQWLLLASGETQAGELLWLDGERAEQLWRLRWDALGRFELLRGEQEEADVARL